MDIFEKLATFNGTNIVNGLDLGCIKPSRYKYVRILISTDYKWGEGWTVEKCEKFKHELYPKFKKVGYEIEKGTFSSSCDNLKKHRTKTRLYLHPMEFTGYATDEDIECICNILKNSSVVYEVRNVITEIAYDMSDREYRTVLNANIKFIEKTIISEYNKNMYSIYDLSFHFGEKFFIRGVGASDTLSSGRVDIEFVSDVIERLIVEGKIKKRF